MSGDVPVSPDMSTVAAPGFTRAEVEAIYARIELIDAHFAARFKRTAATSVMSTTAFTVGSIRPAWRTGVRRLTAPGPLAAIDAALVDREEARSTRACRA